MEGSLETGEAATLASSFIMSHISLSIWAILDTEGVNDAVVAVCRGNGQWSYGYGLFYHRSIFLVGSNSSGKKAKELEVGSGYIGWTVGHTWRTCANVLLITGNYDQGYRNTKQSRPSVLWLTWKDPEIVQACGDNCLSISAMSFLQIKTIAWGPVV